MPKMCHSGHFCVMATKASSVGGSVKMDKLTSRWSLQDSGERERQTDRREREERREGEKEREKNEHRVVTYKCYHSLSSRTNHSISTINKAY